MTPYERLMAEELPTGTFGDARPAPKPRKRTAPASTGDHQIANPTSATAAAEHRRVLEAATYGWELTWDSKTGEARHLHPVPDQTAA
ncbi:hypothetical protein OG301_38940 (plasmid) [Streptomyces platensis]|uniref:hypothetical protein n=1 Tax=Streptomyces platensis TaxID=58346 RepID=UPI002ED5BC39|nr:hypothetical protein OG301_38940 [Streptomyces platensis]